MSGRAHLARRLLVPAACLLVALLGATAASGWPQAPDPRSTSGSGRWEPDVRTTEFLMGTYVVISAEGPGADRAVEEAVAVLQEIHEHLTPSGKRSDLAALAAAPGRKTPVSAHLIKVLEIADEVNRISGGALDPSVGPLLRLWGFDGVSPPRTAPPTAREVREALSLTGWDDVIWDAAGLTATLERPGMALAVGAVAKGYAVDEAARALAETGVERAIIDAGGDLYLLGTRASGEPWRVAVRHPREEGFLGVLELPGDVAVTTSGDYERFFLHDGRRYHHILDPTTGWPVSGVVSVTVVAPTAAEADALATALFVMRPERGLELVESLDRVEALMVDETGALRLSSGMSDIFSPWPPGGDGGAAGEGDGSGAGEDGG